MANVRRFDPARRTHWRSDDELKQIHANLPWNQKRINWVHVVLAFLGSATIAQLGIWEYQRVEIRNAALAAIPPSKTWRNCSEVRAAGVAPLTPSDPGYSRWLDADGDGAACEAYVGSAVQELKRKLW